MIKRMPPKSRLIIVLIGIFAIASTQFIMTSNSLAGDYLEESSKSEEIRKNENPLLNELKVNESIEVDTTYKKILEKEYDELQKTLSYFDKELKREDLSESIKNELEITQVKLTKELKIKQEKIQELAEMNEHKNTPLTSDVEN